MKVLSIVNNNVVRDARVQKEARSLTEAGHEVTIVGVQDRSHLPLNDTIKGIPVVRIPRTGWYASLWKMFSGEGIKGNNSNEGGGKQTTKGWKHLLREWWIPYHRELVFKNFYRGAAQFIAAQESEVLHIHDLNALPVIDHLEHIRAKVVYDAHELYTELATLNPSQRRSYQKVESRLIQKVDVVITVNDSIANELRQRYGIEQPVVVRNCPFLDQQGVEAPYQLRDKLGIPGDHSIILFQGGYSKGRGIESLIEAMKGIKAAHLVLLGWGPLEGTLRALCKGLDLQGKVHFLPPVEQSQLIAVSAQADIGVIPYQAVGLNNYYTSPNKLFEYIHAGLAIAGSEYPELKRVIQHYQIGEVFDPMNVESIRNALVHMVDDRAKTEAFKQNTPKAAQELNWEQEANVLLQVYQQFSPQ